MKGKALLPVIIICAALAIAIMLYLARPSPEQAIIKYQPLMVNAAKVVKQSVKILVNSQGTVSPSTTTILIAEVAGRIIEVNEHFEAGGFFNQGDMLLRIDQRDYLANLKRAEAAVASAKSNLASEQGRAEVAFQDWKKYKSSVKRSEAATALALRKPQLEDAKSKLDSALADLDHARDQLDRTIIRAPYDGLISNKQVDIGQYVNLGSTLANIFAIDTAEIRLAIPQNKLGYLTLPAIPPKSTDFPKVALQTEADGDIDNWQAHLVRTEAVFDERSRVLFAVAEIQDPYGIKSPREAILRMGTFVNAAIEGRTIDNLVTLPRHILRAGNQLWVIDQQQRLQNRKVTILRNEGSHIYVTSGLEEGELVSLSNITGAVTGTKVRVANITPTDTSPDSNIETEQTPASESEGINLAPAPIPDKNNQTVNKEKTKPKSTQQLDVDVSQST